MKPTRAVALFYFIFFGALGIWWPFLTPFLHARGMSLGDTTRLMALVPFAGLVVPPTVGLIADVWHLRGWLLRAAMVMLVLSFVAFFAIGAQGGLWLWVAMSVFAIFRAPINSLADASAFECARTSDTSYGQLRQWGSIGFACAALLGGELVKHRGIDSVLGGTFIALVVGAVVTFRMPLAIPHREPAAFKKWRALLADRALWPLLLAVVFSQIGMSIYDGCFTLFLQSVGASARFVGAAWALGTLAEIMVIAHSARILAWLGAERAYVLALAITAGRWFLLAQLRSPTIIILCQPLHAIAFGLVYVASVTLVRGHARSESLTSAMGIFGAASAVGALIGFNIGGDLLARGGATYAFSIGGATTLAACATAALYEWLTRRARQVIA